MDTSPNRLVLKDFPVSLWVISSIVTTGGVFAVIAGGMSLATLAAVAAFDMLMFLLTPILVITADRDTRTLTLLYRYPLWKKARVIPFGDLREIQVERRVSHDSEGTSTSYRLQAVLKDGTEIPFRSSSSGSRRGKEEKARQLNAFIGLTAPAAGMQALAAVAGSEFAREQEAITGGQGAERETGGVRWRLETRSAGGRPITRWASRDFVTGGGFLYLAQSARGQGKLFTGSVLGGVGDFLLKQTLSLYGFDAAETPGLDKADQFRSLDPRLAAHFMAFGDDPLLARQLLTPWIILPLVNWAEKYPLKQNAANQLVLLYGPHGTVLAVPGLVNAEYLEELATLGVEMVKSQGGGK